MLEEKANKIVENSYTDPVTGKFVHGNPGGGRPKGTLGWASQIMKEAENIAGTLADGTKVTKKEIVIRKLWELAVQGDMRAIEELGNRIDGRPKQSVDVTSQGEKLGGLTEDERLAIDTLLIKDDKQESIELPPTE